MWWRPFDYTQLIWAAILGFLVWGELPHAATLAGAAVVAASGLYIQHRELQRFRRPDPRLLTQRKLRVDRRRPREESRPQTPVRGPDR